MFKMGNNVKHRTSGERGIIVEVLYDEENENETMYKISIGFEKIINAKGCEIKYSITPKEKK